MEKKSAAQRGAKAVGRSVIKPATPAAKAHSGAGKILDTAERLFAKQGFDAVSMNDIARVAGASKANIFHHFSSKKDLYIAVVRRCMADCAEELPDALNGAGSFDEQLRLFARSHLDRLFIRERVTKLISRGLLEGGDSMGRDLAEKAIGDRFGMLVNVIIGGRKTGALRPGADPAMAAILLVSANLFYFQSRSLFRHFPSVDFGDDKDRYSAKLMDILLNGILKPGSGTKPVARKGSKKTSKGVPGKRAV